MVGCVYKHPSANLEEFTLKFEELLKEINLNRYDAYIPGDMNIDLLKHHIKPPNRQISCYALLS